MEFIQGSTNINHSNEVFITLTSFHITWSFRKSSILNTFPESLLGITLSQDPTAREIPIDNPDVTPSAISLLHIILESCGNFKPYLDELKTILSSPDVTSGIHTSSRYLLIPELNLFSDSAVIRFLQRYDYIRQLTNPEYIQEDYETLLREAIDHKYIPYIDYILTHTQPKSAIDTNIFYLDIIEDKLLGVQKLIQYKRIDPITAKPDLEWIAQELSDTDREYLGKTNMNALTIASFVGDVDIVEWILKHTQLRDTDMNAIVSASYHTFKINVIPILIRYNQYPYELGLYLANSIGIFEDNDILTEINIEKFQNIYKLILETQNDAYDIIIWSLISIAGGEEDALPIFVDRYLSFLTPDDWDRVLFHLTDYKEGLADYIYDRLIQYIQQKL